MPSLACAASIIAGRVAIDEVVPAATAWGPAAARAKAIGDTPPPIQATR